jgi:hypothetical protein
MLEQSLRKLFEQQAEAQPPPGRITVADVLRQGRLRRRRHRVGAVGGPAVAAVVVGAIALTGALPSGTIGHTGPQAAYGRLAGGAFDPSYLSVKFGWLPKGSVVTGGQTSPGAEILDAHVKRKPEEWLLGVYARGACEAMTTERRFRCVPAGFASNSTASITSRGPVIAGHRSLWLRGVTRSPGGGPTLAWEYAPDAWAMLQQVFVRNGAATAARIAGTVEYGQHIPFRFASRFTSLPPGWRIIGLRFSADEDLPASVDRALSYSIARLRTISPATPGDPGDNTYPGMPLIVVHPAFPGSPDCVFAGNSKIRQVTIHGYRFALGDSRFGKHGHVQSELDLCGAPLDGLSVTVDEIGVGVHPHLALSPTQVMERMQLLGSRPARWVTNPLP